jgi:hypothetical protein
MPAVSWLSKIIAGLKISQYDNPREINQWN